MNAHLRLFPSILCTLLLVAGAARAQYEIKGGATNLLDSRRAGASATLTGGSVNAIIVRGGGGGYSTPPLVTIAGSGGTTATATAVLTGDVVTAINVTNGGTGYTSPPAVSIAAPDTPNGSPTVTPQYAGAGITSATAGAITTAGVTAGRYPTAQDLTVPAAPVVTMVLTRASFGFSFASGVPRYFMGDEIKPPSVRWDGAAVAQGYWRAKPVEPGEQFGTAYLGNLMGAVQPLVDQFNVDVIESSTTESEVTVASVPPQLTSGSTLLGQKVSLISGTTVRLSGNANQTISSSTSTPFDPYQPYYFSPHANRVFASQAGRVSLTWVSAVPDTTEGGSTPTYKFRSEIFAVSSASQKPARSIFWTEKGFDSPLVSVPAGRIVRANPVYNSFVPSRTVEYVPVGGIPPDGTGPGPESRTLWFDNLNGPPSLHAYNVEGRIFIEYLGAEVQGGTGVHEFLGADIVDMRRVAEVATNDTKLGEQLLPRKMPLPGDDELLPTVVYNLIQGQKAAYGTFIRPDGRTDYFAERESLNPDNVTLYWLEPSDAAIHFLAEPSEPGLSINWPKLKRNYVLAWPESLGKYEPVNVTNTGNTVATGPKFEAAGLPQIAFQDDPAELEVSIDAGSQRLLVDFTSSIDQTNRTLLKFTSTAGPEYVRLYIQAQDLVGHPEISDPDGDGPLTGTPALYTLNDLNGDGILDWSPAADLNPAPGVAGGRTTITVGTRLEPPSPEYALAGHISEGRCYWQEAYLDPFGQEGVKGAAAGGIIPVNALPTDRNLTVWWFKKISPPGSRFSPFYVPAVAARYTVSYPANPQELVIASGKGVENPGLTSVQSAGDIYVQNDPAEIGYNPNEEHALMLAGNAYALRDELNTATSSEPFVLIKYTQPGSGSVPARPAMRVLKVLRETLTYPLTYDRIAATPTQPPLPLTALPLPVLPGTRTARNTEVSTAPDAAAGTGAPAVYDAFTFADRRGKHWIYRGPHNGGAPSFGMRYYYYLHDGFYFPDLTLAQQPEVGSIQPFIADTGGGESVTLTYLPKWPDDPTLPVADQKVLGVMFAAETLTTQKDGLPQIRGQSSAQILYQQSIANTGIANPAVALHDPTRQKITLLETFGMTELPASVLTTDYAGKTYFQNLPPNLQQRFYYNANLGEDGGLVLVGEFVDEEIGEDYLNLNQLSTADIDDLKSLCPATDTTNKSNWNNAIDGLSTTLVTFRESTVTPGLWVPEPGLDAPIKIGERADITDPDTAVDSYALSSTGKGTGYVTLVFNNGENPEQTDPGNPVAVEIIKVAPELYPGDLKVLLASNPLDEQVVLRHSGDYGGEPENFEFEWRYGFSVGGLEPDGGLGQAPGWIDPFVPDLGSSILVGGSPSAVLSTPAVIMGDVWFTMRYRLSPAGDWSDWTTAKQVEGWIKRVLAKITPFNQRMGDLYNNSVNTDVSLVAQAGARWEGNVALNLDNIDDAGLIEIYETILNRGKDFTIGSGIDFSASNDALLLAGGYLNDLYTILGNEAYADAANPTISIDDQDTVTEVNTSRYSFEAQVASSLDEELGLLRGRDDFGLPATDLAPAYNRLWWNYTRGIDSGEVLYAVNYNIQEKAGSPTEDGVLDAADAKRMFPQGHGDAYGHYLTALTGYYKLLTHPDFTWVPSAESVTVLDQSVLVDYKDERKFAASAGNVARTAQQILGLVHRQNYHDDPAAGWSHFRDGEVNPRTSVARHQGLDETASRAAQGSFYHWVTGNAQLPDVDTNPAHTGVQIVDRTTVPELNELVSYADSFQATVDSANAHLNPLGLSPGAIAFDISPTELQAGNSHYEQIYARALRAVLNARGSFNQAAKMTRLLRNQENQIADQQIAIADQEEAYVNQLTEIYGIPYAGDIGPGKAYAQDYQGPDTERWFIIDRPNDLVDTTNPVIVTLRVPTQVRGFTGNTIDDIVSSYKTLDTKEKTFKISPNQFAQFADVVGPGTSLGSRPKTGALQEALLDAHLAQLALLQANNDLVILQQRFLREGEVFKGLVKSHIDILAKQSTAGSDIASKERTKAVLTAVGNSLQWAAEAARDTAEAGAKMFPVGNGFTNDLTSIARGTVKLLGGGFSASFMVTALAAQGTAATLEAQASELSLEMENALMDLGFKQDELQAAYEFELLYRELISQHYAFTDLTVALQRANQQVSNLASAGQSLLVERESFRKRAAALITGYRTKDLTFRTFRNEALEQYRTLFDLSSRYSYLAAKSYDYETGLLGSPQGQEVINRIVASRSLGDLTGDTPQATTSTLGDSGLAGTLAQLNADFSVAEGRLGINNPDQYGTLFSIRAELFDIPTDATTTGDDDAWKQALELTKKTDLMADPDVAKYCNNLRKPDGTPVPGFLITFSTTIQHGMNFFGMPLAAGDHAYSPSSYSTKINSAGLVMKGYLGMDPFAAGTPDAGGPGSSDPDALSATPYVYLIPAGIDSMLAPPFGDTNTVRSWLVQDQALPLPYNLGASDFNTTQFFNANGTLSEQPWIVRKHQAFRPVSDPAFFYSSLPTEFTNSRLIGRSVWNSRWKIVIPAYTLLSDEQDGMNRFINSVEDIQLFLRTYSQSGN